jgi:alkaline phosphatase D
MKLFIILCVTGFFLTKIKAQETFSSSPIRSTAITSFAPFYHGVASGDPLSNQVILWTRITTDSATVNVKWRIATDTCITNIVDSGIISTNATKDFSVKVNATGLEPFTWYYYEFEAYGIKSVRGRTRTLPIGDIDSLRFAIVSCSNYTRGYFNVYSKITERNDVFGVLHLGDFIYEKEGDFLAFRDHDPDYEALNLADYRMRHSQYKLDEDLMRIHQQYPFFSVWDDHEVSNNSWYGGAEDHDSITEGPWFNRKSAGLKAYYEWMPLRLPDPIDTQKIYRKFRFGDLIDLYMLDTRYEARQAQNGIDTDPNRTMLGQTQFDWLIQGMDTSTARWQAIGQQVMMAPLNIQPIPFLPPIYSSDDSWDGYSAERNKILDSVLVKNIQNFVVLTGDIHTSWANDLPTDNYNGTSGAGSAGVEWITPSVTSPGSPISIGASIIKNINDHIKYVELSKQGYVLLDVNKNRMQGEFWHINTILFQGGTESYTEGFYVNNGERHLQTSSGPSISSASMIGIQAPLNPRADGLFCNDSLITPIKTDRKESVLLGVYPNPFYEHIKLQFSLGENVETKIILFDATGSKVAEKEMGYMTVGIHETSLNLETLKPGHYTIRIQMGEKSNSRILIKIK